MTAAIELPASAAAMARRSCSGTSISCRPGEIFALLGKNGMGKSTLLKTIMGYLPVRTGHIRVAGARPRVSRRIGSRADPSHIRRRNRPYSRTSPWPTI